MRSWSKEDPGPPVVGWKNRCVSVLGVDPTYDLFTRHAARYRYERVYPYLRSKGFSVFLCDDRLGRGRLQYEVRRPDTVFMTGSGHGLTNRYHGPNGGSLLDPDSFGNGELAGTMVHLLACDTACVLGSDLVAKGCVAFFGYASSFDYPAGEESEPVLETFLACDSEIDLALADGCTAEQAYRRTYDKYTTEIDKLEGAHRYYAASLLKDNRDRLRAPTLGTAWGNPRAVIGSTLVARSD